MAYNDGSEVLLGCGQEPFEQEKAQRSIRRSPQALFESGDYLEIFDAEHSEAEERFIAIGPIGRGLIVVVWTEAVEDELRIISTRMATKIERQLYRSYMEKWK